MKKNKTIFSALLTVALLLASFSGCAGNKSDSGANGDSVQTSPEETQPTTDAAEYQVDSMLGKMTLEEKVGQMFYVCYPDESTSAAIAKYNLGGLVLFGTHFADKTADEIRQYISAFQNSSKTGLLVGVDEEGGTVVRISDNTNLRSEPFPSPKQCYQGGGWQTVEQTEAEKADLLLSLGVNVNNAPVCDVTSNTESFIYDRSFSGDVAEVCDYVTKTVSICRDKRLGTVLKHFPGYGDNTDTHEDMSYDEKPYEEYQQTDFLPFKAGIDAGADSVMVAHNIVAGIDPEVPASLSPKVHQILRGELGFDGVIMTDDLSMEAVKRYAGADESAVAAAKCGNDMLCCTDVSTQYPAVLSAVKNGEIPEKQINDSVKRILKWKQRLGVLKTENK